MHMIRIYIIDVRPLVRVRVSTLRKPKRTYSQNRYAAVRPNDQTENENGNPMHTANPLSTTLLPAQMQRAGDSQSVTNGLQLQLIGGRCLSSRSQRRAGWNPRLGGYLSESRQSGCTASRYPSGSESAAEVAWPAVMMKQR